MSEDSLSQCPLTPLEAHLSMPEIAFVSDARRLKKMQPDQPQPDLSVSETLSWGEEYAADSLNLLLFPRLKVNQESSVFEAES